MVVPGRQNYNRFSGKLVRRLKNSGVAAAVAVTICNCSFAAVNVPSIVDLQDRNANKSTEEEYEIEGFGYLHTHHHSNH